METNPILLEVFQHRFSSIAEEMGVTLNRTAFSPNIKERRDFSCAVFNADGDMVAQAAHIPVHLGSMPLSVQAAINAGDLAPGDMVALNDPFQGGTHLPDITLVAPVFLGNDRPDFFVANRAHHADVGGMSAGSMPLSTSVFQEGMIIPPLKLVRNNQPDDTLMGFLLANVRTPLEREGDFSAQIMANLTGIRRIKELVKKYDLETVSVYAGALLDYAEKMARETIRAIPNGCYTFEDALEDDGQGHEDIRIHVKLRITDDRLCADFSESAAQVDGSINAVYAITLSSTMYVIRALIAEDLPTNAGCFRPIDVITRAGTIVDATFPAAVAGGNVETSQRIVDVLLGALAQALPDRVPAASQGTMNNITIGGIDPITARPFAYYETICGGTGASAQGDGDSAIHSHMTNTLNSPIEALEYAYPFIVTEYAIRQNSGGQGRYQGGNGVVREIKLKAGAEVTVLSERRKRAPYGLAGGNPGKTGRNRIIQNGKPIKKNGKFSIRLNAGDLIRIETPGGGGFGKK